MGAQHTALSVADQLTRLSREDETPITPMQVQKLAYFCHAWSLGLGFGPLFRDAVESCQQGPVIRSVSHALKPYGGDPITEPLSESAAVFSPAEDKIMAAVWDRYGVIDGLALSRMTHADGTPWHQTHSSDARTQIIHNDVIRDYYADILSPNPPKGCSEAGLTRDERRGKGSVRL